MEARFFSAALIAASALALGASHRTQNFVVTTSSPQLAREIGEAAEVYRRNLAVEWLGHDLPAWREPCPVTVQAAPQLGAGGATSFMFDQGRPFGWRMNIQGSRERLLDSVLPHEVTHMIFATHFGRPLPRWADEGACTTVEHDSEKAKQQKLLITFLTTGRGIAFNRMFAMKEYPADILPLYSQGYALARYLIAMGGKQKFVAYVGDGMNWNDWTAATQRHYGFTSLSELQVTWLEWVRRGSPSVASPATLLAQQTPPPAAPPTSPVAANPVGPLAFASTDASARTAAMTAQAPADGWYVRQRDRARAASGPESKLAATAVPPPSASAVGSGGGEPPARSLLTRPQEIGAPTPTALQWADGPAGSYLQPVGTATPLTN